MTPTPNWDHGWMSQLMGQLKLAAWLVMANCLAGTTWNVKASVRKLASVGLTSAQLKHFGQSMPHIMAFSSQSHKQGWKVCEVYNQNIPPNMNVVISSSLLKINVRHEQKSIDGNSQQRSTTKTQTEMISFLKQDDLFKVSASHSSLPSTLLACCLRLPPLLFGSLSVNIYYMFQQANLQKSCIFHISVIYVCCSSVLLLLWLLFLLNL